MWIPGVRRPSSLLLELYAINMQLRITIGAVHPLPSPDTGDGCECTACFSPATSCAKASATHVAGWMPKPSSLHSVKPSADWLPSWAMTSVSRSEEHTSELQSLMRSSYAVFCLKKK